MLKTVAVLQSNYLPWKGYFDLIHDVDLFIFYDDVQYTHNSWRNRNVIKTTAGLTWITVPVGRQNGLRICDVEIKDDQWQSKHWRTISQSYSRAPFFAQVAPFLEETLLRRRWRNLSELNQHLITAIASRFLGISTRFDDSRNYTLAGHKQDRLMDLLCQVGAQRYISGPSGANYLCPEAFRASGVELVYKDYSAYPKYPQFFSPWEHAVSVIDLLMQTGQSAPDYIWNWRQEAMARDSGPGQYAA
jgi:hypothetical protein